MQKKFLQNLVFLVLLNILIKPFWLFGIDRAVQNAVGPEEYGLYFALFNFSFLLHIILDLGISNFNNRNIAQHSHLLTKYFPNIIMIKVILAFVYLILTFIIAFLWDYSTFQLQLLGILAINQILSSLILYFRSNLAGLHLFKLDSVFSVMDKFIMIVICGVLLWGNVTNEKFHIEWFIYAQTASLFITALFSFSLVLKRTKVFRLRWKFPLLLLIFKQSYPFALLGALMAIYMRIDGIMIERLLPETGRQEAGYYASAYRILDACHMVSFLFATLLLPIFSRMLKQKQPIEQLTKLSIKSLVIPAIIFCFATFFYQKEIMYQLYKYASLYSSKIFGILIFCFIPISLAYIFGTLLTANGNLKILNIIALAGVTINIVLNYFLIKKYHALGATIATFATQYLIAFFQVFFAKKIFNFKVSVKVIMSFIVFIIGLIIINYFMQGLTQNWKFNFFLSLILSMFLGFILKFIDLKSIFNLFESNKI